MDQSISLIRDEFIMEMLVHSQSLEEEDANLIAISIAPKAKKIIPQGFVVSKCSRQEYCPLPSSY